MCRFCARCFMYLRSVTSGQRAKRCVAVSQLVSQKCKEQDTSGSCAAAKRITRWRETQESSSTFKADASHMTGGKALWAVYSKTHQVCTSSHTETLTGQSLQHHKPILIDLCVLTSQISSNKQTNKQKKADRIGPQNLTHVSLSWWTNNAGEIMNVAGYERRNWLGPLAVVVGLIYIQWVNSTYNMWAFRQQIFVSSQDVQIQSIL